MEASTSLLGVKATACIIAKAHTPPPLRFVWHHVQPHEAGGPTTAANLIEVCDSCHYSIHRLMWEMANDLPMDHPPRVNTYKYAAQGYSACVKAGTVAQIPNEG